MRNKKSSQATKRMSVYLACTLVMATPIVTVANVGGEKEELGNLIKFKGDDVLHTTGSMIEADVKDEKDRIIYDFSDTAKEIIVPTSYTALNPIDELYSLDGILKINGTHSMYHDGSEYGLVVKEGNSFEIQVAGNADIIFEIYSDSASGGINASIIPKAQEDEAATLTGGIQDGRVAFAYTGGAATLIFSIVGDCDHYLKSISVEGHIQTSTSRVEATPVKQSYVGQTSASSKAVASIDDLSRFSSEGYAENATGGGVLEESDSNYYKVATAAEFLGALNNIKKAKQPGVIELTQDIGLGNLEIGSALSTYSSLIKAANNQPLLHPTLKTTGVSTLYIKDMSDLTIYSKNGSALKHTCIDISRASNVIIRNVVFDELWEWDEGGYTSSNEYCEPGDYDRNDWDYITIQNESTDIWIDHCTFYKAYDGIVDVKKAASTQPTNVTISWCEFLPESRTSFYDDMMRLLESNPSAYPYYEKLIKDYGMTKEQVRGYAAAQKKTHLIGASDKEANIKNLQVTLANNHYKDSMDRMPRLRGGSGHVYNCIMDASETLTIKKSIANSTAASKIVSNGAISTCGASLLVENAYIDGIMKPLLSGNGSSPAGAINAVNSVYYLENQLKDLTVAVSNNTTGADQILDATAFVAQLPYNNYKLYDANDLKTQVLPYTGAGAISMTSREWQETKYEAPIVDEVEKVYTVTFEYNGADENNEVAQIEVIVDQIYGTLPEPKKAGYIFLGWYTEAVAGERITDVTAVTREENHTLYARWLEDATLPDSGDTTPPDSGDTTPPDSGDTTPPESGDTTPPDSGDTTPPDSGDTTPPDSGDTTPPDSGDTTPPDSGDTTPPDSGDTTPPDSGDTTPPDSGDTTPPDSGDTTPPDSGDTTPPDSGDTTPPDSGDITPPDSGDTTPPDSGDTTPPDSGDTTPPDSGDTTPPDSGDTTPPDSGDTTPPDSGDTTPPDSGDTTPPDSGDTTPPDSGDTTPPDSGDTTPPDSGDTTPPDSGDTIPPDSGDTTPPDSGDTTPPDSGDTPLPDSGDTTPPESGDITPPESGDTTPPNSGSTGGSKPNSGTNSNESQLTEDVVVEPEQTPVIEVTFADTATHWAEESITYVVDKGLFKGVDDTHFAPNVAMTRGMMISVLHRLAGEPEAFGKSTFVDVEAGSWYETAITWANEKGITIGVASNKFNPNEAITREEMIMMLYRYIGSMKVNLDKVDEEIQFEDQENIAFWAKSSIEFIAQTGIIQGDEMNRCNPKEVSTRAQASAMLHRFMEIAKM